MTMEEREMTCKRCGYRWEKRTKEPRKCPRCQTYRWNQPKDPRLAYYREQEPQKDEQEKTKGVLDY